MTLHSQQDPVQELANGVVFRGKFFPYFRTGVGAAVSPGTAITPRTGTRFYVKRIQVGYRQTAGDTTAQITVNGTIMGKVNNMANIPIVPSSAVANTVITDVGLLCDLGTSIYVIVDVAGTQQYAYCTVAELDDV